MKKYIDENINSESLLTEYDRENTYLNRQILDLLKQNKSLKFDNIRGSIIDRSSSKILSREAGKNPSNRGKNSSKKIENKSRYHTETAVDQRKHTKDEEVQVGDIFNIKANHIIGEKIQDRATEDKIQNRTTEEKIQDRMTGDKRQDRAKTLANSAFQQDQDIGSFSFGENTRKQMKQKKQILQIQQLDVQETVKKYQNKQIKSQPLRVIQIEKQSRQSTKRGESIVVNKDHLKILPKEEEPPNKLIKQKRDRSLASHQRPRQSHHSIDPSPQIAPCKSEKSLANTPAASIKNRLETQKSQQIGRRNQSKEKGKRFLSLISTKLAVFPIKTEGSVSHCC